MSPGDVELPFGAPPHAATAKITVVSTVFMLALSHASRPVSNAVMQLFVVRHAAAEGSEPGSAGAARELTDAGRTKLRRAVRGLAALEIRFDSVLTSPWKRAAQTARLLEPIAAAPPIATELLTQSPGASLLALLAQQPETAAVVGHEPWLGELVAWLAFGDSKHGDALLIKKGGVLWLEGTPVPGGMQLRASLPPKVLRALG
jgi:phosphohistidine phosphatase